VTDSKKFTPSRKKFDEVPQLRLYHTRFRVSATARLPILVGHPSEIANLFFLRERHALEERTTGDLKIISRSIGGNISPDSTTDHPIVGLIESLPGVEYVVAFTYAVAVIKAQEFEWDVLEKDILKALATYSLELPDATYDKTKDTTYRPFDE